MNKEDKRSVSKKADAGNMAGNMAGNVQEIAQTNEFSLEVSVTSELVQKLVLNWAIGAGLNVKELRETRGRGYTVSYAAKAAK